MEYTQQQKQAFTEEFGRRKSRQLLATVPFIVLFLGSIFLADQQTGMLLGIPAVIWSPVAIAAVLGLVVFSLKNWRCPACNRYLGKGFNPAFCPKCGVQLKAGQ